MTEKPLFAHVNGIRIAYDKSGSGYPLLLLHGFPRTRHVWSRITPSLASRFTVVAPDRRGYGDSDRPKDPVTYDNLNMVKDALELARHLGWRELLVMGHNKGAPVAQRLAADHPETVRGAFLIDALPQGVPTGLPRDPTGRQWYFDFFRQRGVAEQLINANARLFFSLFLDRNPHLPRDEHEFYVEAFCRPGTVEAVLADYRAGLEVDPLYWESWLREGRKIPTPLYVIWGARGPSANAPVLELWRRIAQDVRGEAVPSSAHYVQEEQPQATVQHLLRFADQLGIP